MLANSIKKYIGSYIAEMNGIDALVFTAGIGENSDMLRGLVCEDLEFFGISIDKEKNATMPRGSQFDISAADARVRTLVIPTNEEYMIALDTLNLCKE
jgi:acetate kinase